MFVHRGSLSALSLLFFVCYPQLLYWNLTVTISQSGLSVSLSVHTTSPTNTFMSCCPSSPLPPHRALTLTQTISAAGLLEELVQVRFMPCPAVGWLVDVVMLTVAGGTEIIINIVLVMEMRKTKRWWWKEKMILMVAMKLTLVMASCYSGEWWSQTCTFKHTHIWEYTYW